MVREDILGGLALAMQKGEPLQQAMMTFLNAGYRREEIDEAARFLQGNSQQQIPNQRPLPAKTQQIRPVKRLPQTPSVNQIMPQQPMQQPQQQVQQPQQPQIPMQPQQIQKPQPIQKQEQKITPKVSSYGSKLSARTIVIITLSAILVILLLSLGGVFLFRDSLISFFNSVF